MDRASDYESEGHKFKSYYPRQKEKGRLNYVFSFPSFSSKSLNGKKSKIFLILAIIPLSYTYLFILRGDKYVKYIVCAVTPTAR